MVFGGVESALSAVNVIRLNCIEITGGDAGMRNVRCDIVTP